MSKKKNSGFIKTRLLLAFILGGAIVIMAILELTNTTHFFHNSSSSTVIKKAGTPVPAPTSNVSGSTSPSSKTPSANNTPTAGGSVDTGGTAPTATTQSQWIVSQSGNITLKQPIANSTLQDGAVISGSANVSQVSFRLVDNQIGVIDQGVLNVTNGNFSGILHFKSQATSGQLDVFSTEANAKEINEIQVTVTF